MINGSIHEDISPNEKLSKCQFAIVALGAGEMLGGLIVGKIIDVYSSKIAVFTNLTIIVIMTALSIWFIIIDNYNVLTFFMTFFWGLQDAALNTHSSQMLGFEFATNVEPYSIFNLC